MILAPEIIKKIKRIEIKSKRLSNETLSGDYKSAFKGRGVSFEDLREYEEGDDIRLIDWNSTARLSKPYVKVFREERELSMHLIVDFSSSMSFGSRASTKREFTAELCAALAFSAISNNDKIGLIAFSDKIERYAPPRKGAKHALRIIRDIFEIESESKKTDLKKALEFAANIIKRRGIIILISDFYDTGFIKELGYLGGKYDVVAINIQDAFERKLPDLGIVELIDPETGQDIVADFSNKKFRQFYENRAMKKAKTIESELNKARVDFITLDIEKPFIDKLSRFLSERAEKRKNRY